VRGETGEDIQVHVQILGITTKASLVEVGVVERVLTRRGGRHGLCADVVFLPLGGHKAHELYRAISGSERTYDTLFVILTRQQVEAWSVGVWQLSRTGPHPGSRGS